MNRSRKKNGTQKLSVAAAIVLSLSLLLAGCATSPKGSIENANVNEPQSSKVESSSAQSDSVQVIKKGETLTISTADITETMKLYPVKVDGTTMEVLAVKASDGSIRTAFNTCEVCYDSGKGYYKQEGEELVCQNCGNRFGTDQVEMPSRGCNPWPIFKESKTITQDTITISYDVLSESTKVFANWKRT